jgi:hypothetical protein
MEDVTYTNQPLYSGMKYDVFCRAVGTAATGGLTSTSDGVSFLTAGATQISSISETTTNSACGCSTSSCDSNDTIMAAAVPSICLTLVIAVIVIITRRRIAILKNEVMKSRNETRGSLQMTNKVCGQSHSSPHEMESYMRSSSAYALSVVAASKFEESNYEEIPHIREYNDPTYESVEKTD